MIAHLQNEARKVLDVLIPNNAHIILLDYPHYPNVGDSLIWLGEIAYLKSRGLKPSYVCDIKNYSYTNIRKILNNNSIILINGGGNFGDLWKNLFAFKLRVLKDFPLLPIVQLPQTIHFESDVAIAEMAEVIKSQGNFTLLVRCHESLALAEKNFVSKNILCPDMAFFIGPVITKTKPIFDLFILSRTDVEKSSSASINTIKFNNITTFQVADWLDISWQERVILRTEIYSQLIQKKLDPNNKFLLAVWNLLSFYRLKRGAALLSRGKIVITDRLHAHILSILMNKPHVLMDNSYGKLSHFYQAWTSNFTSAKFAVNVNEVEKNACSLSASLRKNSQSDFLQSENIA